MAIILYTGEVEFEQEIEHPDVPSKRVKNINFKYTETVEEFLARGGTIKRFAPSYESEFAKMNSFDPWNNKAKRKVREAAREAKEESEDDVD